MRGFSGKTVLVVGASSGIGKAAAERLADAGASVVLVARREGVIREMAQRLPGSNLAVPCDMKDLGSIEGIFGECVRRAVRIDGAVYSAGTAPLCALKDNDIETMCDTVKVNALAFAQMAKCMLNSPCMAQGASVVAMSSVASVAISNRQSAYGSSKAMLNAYVKRFAKEALGRFRVNAVLPGAVGTQMYEELKKQSEGLEERLKRDQPLSYQ